MRTKNRLCRRHEFSAKGITPRFPAMLTVIFSWCLMTLPVQARDLCTGDRGVEQRKACLRAAVIESDSRLNRVFAAALSLKDDASRKTLRSDEVAWIKTRDKECKNLILTSDRGNWIEHVVSTPELAWCVIEQTDARAARLRAQSVLEDKQSHEKWNGFRLAYAKNQEVCDYASRNVEGAPEYRSWPEPAMTEDYRDNFGTVEWRRVRVPRGYGNDGWVAEIDIQNDGHPLTLLNNWYFGVHGIGFINIVRVFSSGTDEAQLQKPETYTDKLIGAIDLHGSYYCLDKCIDEADCRVLPDGHVPASGVRVEGPDQVGLLLS